MRSNRSPALGFIFVTLLIDITGWGIIIPVMPKLIIEVSGLTPDTPFAISNAAMYSGWLISAYAIDRKSVV